MKINDTEKELSENFNDFLNICSQHFQSSAHLSSDSEWVGMDLLPSLRYVKFERAKQEHRAIWDSDPDKQCSLSPKPHERLKYTLSKITEVKEDIYKAKEDNPWTSNPLVNLYVESDLYDEAWSMWAQFAPFR